MPRLITEAQSLPFYQVVGAPLLALVQAEAQAAQATAEFIDQVGFVKTEKTGADELGRLRMVTFRYQKVGTDGRVAEFQVQVPLLSLVPIPAIQVKTAEIEFTAQVTDVYTEEVNTPVKDGGDDANHPLAPTRVGFRAALSKRNDDNELKMKIQLEQADIPVGLAAMFKIMEQSINSQTVTTPPVS